MANSLGGLCVLEWALAELGEFGDQMFGVHGIQQGTMIHRGQSLNLNYSLTQSFPL